MAPSTVAVSRSRLFACFALTIGLVSAESTTSWAQDPLSNLPSTNGTVNAVAVSGGTIYIGGSFTIVGATPRNNVAAIDSATGAVKAWNPNADGAVFALLVNGSTVFAGGSFMNIGGQSRTALAALGATSGKLVLAR